MPNLKMTTGLSGPDFSLLRGDEREFDEAEASRLIRAGFAVATDGFVPIDLPADDAEDEGADEDAAAAAKAEQEAADAKAAEEAAAAAKAEQEAADAKAAEEAAAAAKAEQDAAEKAAAAEKAKAPAKPAAKAKG